MTLAAQAAVAVDNVRRLRGRATARGRDRERPGGRRAPCCTTLDIDALLPARRPARAAPDRRRDGRRGGARRRRARVPVRARRSTPSAWRAAAARSDPDALAEPAADLARRARGAGVRARAWAASPPARSSRWGGGPFDEGARRLLETFSSQVAVALVNARAVAGERESLLEAAQREAAEDPRARGRPRASAGARRGAGGRAGAGRARAARRVRPGAHRPRRPPARARG